MGVFLFCIMRTEMYTNEYKQEMLRKSIVDYNYIDKKQFLNGFGFIITEELKANERLLNI